VSTDRPFILVLNAGSSSLKLALIDPQSGRRTVTGLGERVGSADASAHLSRDGRKSTVDAGDGSHREVVQALLGALTGAEREAVHGVGHRVVHGGSRFSASVAVDDRVLADLKDLVDLAPLHMPANILGIEAARAAFAGPIQVAVFDTAFHQTMPPVAYRYAVPIDWYVTHQVRRYGFHGTSHRYVSAEAARLLGRPPESLRMVTLHLGNGCSAAAVGGGVSLDTTMGMTPLEGLVMGTRSGDIDPGVLGYIAGRLDLDLAGVLDVLNNDSGVAGLSGISNDNRTLWEAADAGSADAALALDVFAYRIAKSVGALAVALGGLDAVVFTGGIGEHSPDTRQAVLARLGVFGLAEDPAANAANGSETAGRISAAGPVSALVVHTDEELLIARDTLELAQ